MNNIQPIWLRYGIIYGLTSILISLISYYIITIGSGTQLILSFIFLTLFMVMSGKAEKQNNGDVLSYGEALKTTFLTAFIGIVISTLFTIIMINLIDPSLVDKLIQQYLDFVRWFTELFGAPEDVIEEALEKSENEIIESFTPSKQLFGSLKISIIIFFYALILSIFIKKDEDIHKIDINSLGNPS